MRQPFQNQPKRNAGYTQFRGEGDFPNPLTRLKVTFEQHLSQDERRPTGLRPATRLNLWSIGGRSRRGNGRNFSSGQSLHCIAQCLSTNVIPSISATPSTIRRAKAILPKPYDSGPPQSWEIPAHRVASAWPGSLGLFGALTTVEPSGKNSGMATSSTPSFQRPLQFQEPEWARAT